MWKSDAIINTKLTAPHFWFEGSRNTLPGTPNSFKANRKFTTARASQPAGEQQSQEKNQKKDDRSQESEVNLYAKRFAKHPK